MKFCRTFLYSLVLVCLLHITTVYGWAIGVKRPSDYGTNPTAAYWNLLAPIAPVILRSGTKSATLTRQIVCPDYDVANAEYPSDTANSGTCEDGDFSFNCSRHQRM